MRSTRLPRSVAPALCALLFVATAISANSGVTREAAAANPEDHWAFQRIERPAMPAGAILRHPLDALLEAKWTGDGIVPQPPADEATLLRRLFLDLTGLPPTPADHAEFLDASRPDAVARIVERLLGNPRHAEHWGRHWMDVWRYSDWYGLGDQLRYSQKHIWHWRDWIIESLAADSGYDDMIMAMLAGDEWKPGDLDTARATGFLARSYFLFNRTTWLDDTIEHTNKAFLGLTMNCAKCHDHKFDPVTQLDYYRMRAIFEPHQVRVDVNGGQLDLERDGIARAFDDHPEAPTFLHIRGNEATPDTTAPVAPGIPTVFGALDIVPVALPADAWAPGTRAGVQQAALDAARGTGEDAFAAVQARVAADNARFQDDADADTCARLAGEAARLEWKAELAELGRALTTAEQARRALDGSPDTGAQATADKALAEARGKLEALEQRGPAESYTPLSGSRKALETPEHNFDTYTATYSRVSTGRRLAFAKWITSRDNPLAARVAVNHLWLRTMGRPLAADVTDFGFRAKAPAHQDVLDFLAVELMDNDWSLKHVLRLITTSAAYQRESSTLQAHPGTLAADPGNAHYWRATPRRMTAQMLRDAVKACAGSLDLQMGGPPVDPSTDTGRRGVYFRHSRDERLRFHDPFDDASIVECYRRQESVAPQQALALMNDREVYSACARLAAASMESGESRPDFLDGCFLRILGRAPTRDEGDACAASLEALAGEGSTEQRARTTVALALFNHNDFITIR